MIDGPSQGPNSRFSAAPHLALMTLMPGRWHQMYVDVNGNVTWYSGGLHGKDMELTAPGKQGSIQKMVYRPLPDGSVKQVGTVSVDGGKTWQPGYDYTYRKTKKAAERG